MITKSDYLTLTISNQSTLSQICKELSELRERDLNGYPSMNEDNMYIIFKLKEFIDVVNESWSLGIL
jgi:hypothetical protein